MSEDPFHLNRPVHLARRDVFYQKAVECIKKLPAQKRPDELRETAERALVLLQEARRHAEAANRSEKTSVQSQLFESFIDMMIDGTQSVTRMVSRQISYGTANNPLDRFFVTTGSGEKMSKHCRRCAAMVLKGLLDILQQAEKPTRDLRQTSIAKMTGVDKNRYEKAYRHFEELIDKEAGNAVGRQH